MAEFICLFYTIELFAESVGVTQRTVEGWIERGFIPTIKIGKRRLINGHAIKQQLEEASEASNDLIG